MGAAVVGVDDGAGVGENVAVSTLVTVASAKPRRRAHARRRRVASATIAAVKEPSLTTMPSVVSTYENMLP